VAISSTTCPVRFGVFELDTNSRQLSRNGMRLRLPQQPIQVLCLLVGRPGEIITREELRKLLWPADVFVDFDQGLNKSILKLREALGDSPGSPRYIETIPRVGYRFIAPVITGVVPQNPAIQTGAAPLEVDAPAALPSLPSDPKRIHRRRTWFAIAGCAAAVLLLVGWLVEQRRHAVESIHSVAVLPLDNLSGDPSQEYFADGMTDELITMLARNSTLRIVSRTSVMQYKGAHRPLREIARALGVDGILEGSVERSSDKVHMTIQLIQAKTDTHLWAQSYDRSPGDVSALPAEAAREIAKQLHSSVQTPTVARFVSAEAHDAYLRGQYYWVEGKNEEAGKYFRQAVQLQPDYAPGWVGLSEYYGVGALRGAMPPSAAQKAEAYGQKAVELDSQLPEAHLMFGGAILLNRWDWARGLEEISRAIELNPREAQAYHMRAITLAWLGRTEEAVTAQKQATELDPFYHPSARAEIYNLVRQYDAAIADARMRVDRTPGIFGVLAESYRGKGMKKEAAEMLAQQFAASGDTQAAAAIRHAYQLGGYDAVVRWQLGRLEKKSPTAYVSPVSLAELHAQLGEREETLSLLEQGLREHSTVLLWIRNDPAYDFLHSDPRYQAIVQRIGLPPASAESDFRSFYGFACMPEGSAPGFAGGTKVTGMLCPRWQVPQATVF
jgi:TolB-like protein/DNA-binding winged helix-turn-helix (wHTH) protein